MTGNGTFTVGGVGGIGGADGQGASLVVIYRTNSPVARTGRVVIRHGALSAASTGATMSTTFSNLVLPVQPSLIRLNAAVADGQAPFTEVPMTFGGQPISPANSYDGSDGPLWDDDRLTVPNGMLSAGSNTRTNSLTTGNDCLAWAYSALSYQHLF